MRYTSDLTVTEWNLISYCFPAPAKKERPREHSFRELLNAIFFLNKTGCQWRNIPVHFAPWGTVYRYFRRWKQDGLWEAIHTHLREHLRLLDGRQRQAGAAIIDSQSVKHSEMSEERGYDAGKKINGRKRHLLVDTLGLVLRVMALPGNIQDRDGARQGETGETMVHLSMIPAHARSSQPRLRGRKSRSRSEFPSSRLLKNLLRVGA